MSHPLPAQSFGKYQILERIAAGETAEVFKARLEGIGGFQRTFAIKRIRPGLSQNRDYIETLVDEAKIAGLLSHANIVQILDLGQVNGLYYVAMEYVDGEDLGTVLARCSSKGITFPVPHAIFVCLELLKGLEYAHSRSILRGGREVPLKLIHRDLSPSNILLSFQGEVKLTDFGIARANADALAGIPSLNRGRYDYMSPEQIEGAELDVRSDIFAVGVVLYELLCGAHPFRRSDNQRTREAVLSGEYEPPTMTNPDVPYGLEVILEQALARDREQRFASSTELKGALNKFFHDSGFIFSQSTLATFLKGLFPTLGTARYQGLFHEDETRPLQPSDQAARLAGQELAEDDLETQVGDPDTVEARLLSDDSNITLARSVADEPTKAATAPAVSPPSPPRTLADARDDLPPAQAAGEDEWDDAQATEIWRVPDDKQPKPEHTEAAEKTLVGGPAAQAHQPSAPAGPPAQERPAGTPRIEKRAAGGRQAREERGPPDTGPDSAHDDVEIGEATGAVPGQLQPTPTLAPLDDAAFAGSNPRELGAATTRPIPRPPAPTRRPAAPIPAPPPAAPDGAAAAEPSPDIPPSRTEPLGSDEPALLDLPEAEPPDPPDSLADAVARQMAAEATWRPPEQAPAPAAPAAAESTATEPTPARPSRFSRAVAFLSIALALAGTLAGGFTLGVAAMLNQNPDIEEPVILKAEPRLLVSLPAGGRLTVDGRDVPVADSGPTEVTLAPGVATRIRIELSGYAPYEQLLTLDYNDLRVLAFEPVELTADGR